MGTNDNKNVKFILSVVNLIIAVVTYIVYVATDNDPLAGVLFVAPSIMEFLEDITVNREEIKNDNWLVKLNWLVFAVVLISIVLFTLTAIGVFGEAALFFTSIILVVIPAKYAYNVAFYYNKL